MSVFPGCGSAITSLAVVKSGFCIGVLASQEKL